MKVYLFNPGHDEALAAGTPYYTPVRIARAMTDDLWMLPRFYADEDCEALRVDELKHFDRWDDVSEIVPWGWDAALVHRLMRHQVPHRLLPSDHYLQQLRRLSSRETAVQLLARLSKPAQVISCFFSDIDSVARFAEKHGGAVAKAPWSCSGRGLVKLSPTPTPQERQRLSRIVQQQGGIAVEPFYYRTADFAMEFFAQADGTVTYVGLSVFRTTPNGKYIGNLIASEKQLLAELSPFDFETTREEVRRGLETLISDKYVGPIGVDMLQFSSDEGIRTCPCVEINMRYTMGFLALHLYRTLPVSSDVGLLRLGTYEGEGQFLCGNPEGVAMWVESIDCKNNKAIQTKQSSK